tara:strand:- start:330 stop:542 length:213 start_codon:yes stop_codon:yes gene_type:complete
LLAPTGEDWVQRRDAVGVGGHCHDFFWFWFWFVDVTALDRCVCWFVDVIRYNNVKSNLSLNLVLEGTMNR